MHAGLIAATVANTQRDPKRKPDPYSASDFLLKFGQQELKADPQLIMNGFKAAVAKAGLKVVRG